MAKLTYQAKLKLKKALKIAAIVLAVLLVLAVARFVYLGRYVVYGEGGAHLDYGTTLPVAAPTEDSQTAGQFVLKSDAATSAEINLPAVGALPRLDGTYLPLAALLEEPAVTDRVTGNAVLADVKTGTGKFLYATALPDTEQSTMAPELGPRLTALAKTTGVTAVARLPAFRDSARALANMKDALPITGGALWMDESGSYWLDPGADAVREYLIDQAMELARMGFEEIVFEDFSYPLSPNIVYEGDGVTATREAARVIADALNGKNIPVSFVSRDEEIMKLSARSFVTAGEDTLVSEVARKQLALLGGGEERLVFLTNSHDTRFEQYSVLSPCENTERG